MSYSSDRLSHRRNSPTLKSLCLQKIRSYTFREWIEWYAQYRFRHNADVGAKLVNLVEQVSQYEEWCDCK
jgi:hypothetical protein